MSMLGFGENHLSVYLNDHLAGATAGVNLARRVADHDRSGAGGDALDAVADEIEEDRRTLLDVMERLSVEQDRVRAAIGWGTEQASRLKLGGTLIGHSPLRRLEELEALSLGVAGKLALWQALRHTHGEDPRLEGIDIEDLIGRARSQRSRLERRRTRAADEALRG
jgi:hypothetical protein